MEVVNQFRQSIKWLHLVTGFCSNAHVSYVKKCMNWALHTTYKIRTYSEPSQRSKTEVFTKISNDFKPLTIFATYSILDTWLDFEYAPENRIPLTHFSPVLHFIYKSIIWFEVQIKWLVSIWNATPGWNGLSKVNSKLTQVQKNIQSSCFPFFLCLLNRFLYLNIWEDLMWLVRHVWICIMELNRWEQGDMIDLVATLSNEIRNIQFRKLV